MKILITGSTDGIGKLTAIKLAKDRHEIYIHARNKEKLEKTIEEIKQVSNNDKINGFVADFSDMRAVKSMANDILKEITQLDVLINNAGVYKTSTAITSEGFDIHFAVNYFAPYILTNTLIPILNENGKSRVINLSSAAQSSIQFNALEGKETLPPNLAYAQSKLALTMWSFYFAHHHNDIVTIAINPGSLLNTKMAQEVYGKHWSSADKGANALCALAVSPVFKNDSGKYFDNDLGDEFGHFNEAYPDAYNKQLVEKLINTTNQIVERELK